MPKSFRGVATVDSATTVEARPIQTTRPQQSGLVAPSASPASSVYSPIASGSRSASPADRLKRTGASSSRYGTIVTAGTRAGPSGSNAVPRSPTTWSEPSPVDADETDADEEQDCISREEKDSRGRSGWLTRMRNYAPYLELENAGSVARDHLALERTYLAYVRTSLAIASAGVGAFSSTSCISREI